MPLDQKVANPGKESEQIDMERGAFLAKGPNTNSFDEGDVLAVRLWHVLIHFTLIATGINGDLKVCPSFFF